MKSTLNIANGFYMFKDETFVFAGYTKKTLNHNFVNYAFFLMRADPFTDVRTCMKFESIPDKDAITYGVN
jgi:hypothetical protein